SSPTGVRRSRGCGGCPRTPLRAVGDFRAGGVDRRGAGGEDGGMNERPESENLPRVLSVLERLTEEELVELNRMVVARLRLMQQGRAQGEMMGFRVGQKVRFQGNGGEVVRGTVVRHNAKSVTVVTDAGASWRVAPGLLE